MTKHIRMSSFPRTFSLNTWVKSHRYFRPGFTRRIGSGAFLQAFSSSRLLSPPRLLSLSRHVRTESQKSTAHAGSASKIYTFADIKAMISRPSKNIILIDTREPSELLQTGYIPTAINIPIASAPDSLFISDDAFNDRFGFERPSKEKEIVFYCKSGVRSKAAAELARQGGWEAVGEYPGSWMDWEKLGGDKKRN